MSIDRRPLRLIITIILFLAFFPGCLAVSQAKSDFARQREEMVAHQIIGGGITDKAVIAAMRKVPRHMFVPERLRGSAYEDRPLPIGDDQTISQPYVVALMTQLLSPGKDDRVLEIGTGSGYQAAILAEIVKEVYSIEIIEALHSQAKKTLESLGYTNITLKWGDGYAGWKEYAPFDAIIVTAAAEKIPPALIEQLKVNGRLCMPVGSEGETQKLILAKKTNSGKLESSVVTEVIFVPLTRKKR